MIESLIEEVRSINHDNDLFNTYDKITAIVEFIQDEENKELLSKNNLIAIYGEWGSGKSCIMKTIEGLLGDKFETRWFNTWKYEKDDNLPYSLFKYILKEGLIDKILKGTKITLQSIYTLFKSFTKGVEISFSDTSNSPYSTSVNISPGEILGNIESDVKENEESKEIEKCLWEKIDDFEQAFKKLKFHDKRLVVFLDDLDRCDSENIINLVSSIKLLLSINPNIIFIFGIDKEAVTLALKNKYKNDYNKADEYLEKIFPINFNILNVFNKDRFSKYIKDITNIDNEKITNLFDKLQFNNPRHLKKVLKKYMIIEKYLTNKGIDLNSEYNVMLVLYCIILNNFYIDEYIALLSSQKEEYYSNILLEHFTSDGDIVENSFQAFHKSCDIDHKNYDIYSLLEKLSSCDFVRNKISITLGVNRLGDDRVARIELFDWNAIFDNNICKKFIAFILDDTDFLDFFYKENIYQESYINNIINEVDHII